MDTIKRLREAYKYVLETPFESFIKTSIKMVYNFFFFALFK